MSKEELNQMSNNELIGVIKAQKFEIEQLESIRKEAIEWCKCVINSKTTAGELPNGKRTDMGYCLDLAEPLLNILNKGDNKE
jgi:hypothetical protein